MKQNKFEKSESEFLKALELRADYLEAHMNLATLYAENNLLEKSAFHYRKVIEIKPDNGRAYYSLAHVSRKNIIHPWII